jgi:hypothetical protein
MTRSSKLNVGAAPMSRWTVTESLKQLGLEHALEKGQISVAADGTVKVRGDASEFEGALRTEADLRRLLTAIGKLSSRADTHVPTQQALAIFGTARDADIENRVNTHLWYGQKLQTELRPEFIGGRRYPLPLVVVPPEHAVIRRTSANIRGLDEVAAYFRRADGSVLLPMHPQELEHRSYARATETLDARNASSERTLHVQLPGALSVLVKTDLAHITHSTVVRPLDAAAAEASIAMTDFLSRWVKLQGEPGDAFAFLPEALSVADVNEDVSAIIRIGDPHPPPADGAKTWVVPMYSLSAPDPDFPEEPPMLMRLVNSRPDPGVPPLEYALDTVVGPLIESALRVYLDLGSSAQAHGQNTFLEIGDDGRPTGRVAHSDLEAFWPHPDLAKPLGRDEFYERFGFAYQKVPESDIYQTFDGHFVKENLRPMVDCLSHQLGMPRGEVSAAVRERMVEGIERRRDVVLNHPVLAGFKTYLR